MIIKLTIPGEPQGKQRARWSKRGTYTPKETVNYETYIKELFVIKYPDFVPMEGPLRISLDIKVSIPASTSKKRRDLMARMILKPTKKPDFDNIHKVVCDALEKLAYKNDNQFVFGSWEKNYSNQPRLEITIWELA
jgi:Holliday junction resolvase RusA-like endonuclease